VKDSLPMEDYTCPCRLCLSESLAVPSVNSRTLALSTPPSLVKFLHDACAVNAPSIFLKFHLKQKRSEDNPARPVTVLVTYQISRLRSGGGSYSSRETIDASSVSVTFIHEYCFRTRNQYSRTLGNVFAQIEPPRSSFANVHLLVQRSLPIGKLDH
jgi:hypothetical protein